jgi:hypothetical protein
MEAKTKLEPNPKQASAEDINYYQQLIGSLLFLALAVRADICFAVIKLARFASNPSETHFLAIKRIFRYLKGTAYLGIVYSKGDPSYIQGYADADYAGDQLEAKSTTGYLLFIAGGVFMWKSKLQSIIAQSTTEAETVAINACGKELAFIKILLMELGLFRQSKLPLYCDNNGAILLAKNPIFHERTKHIKIKYYYIRQLINEGIIDLIFIPTKEQKADGLTKPLPNVGHQAFIAGLGLKQ